MGALMSASVFCIKFPCGTGDFGAQVTQFCRWVGVVVSLSVFSACAQIVSPSGGPRDSRPPQLDSLLSTPNYQTNFQKQDILLVFDEFIKLEDPYGQLVVSPPLSKRPSLEVEKYRRLRFRFAEDEILHPNTTYTIYFGQAIRDFTEGNVADLRFVFSTGERIDSLRAEGQLVDARTGEAVGDVLVFLYEARTWSDSAVNRQLPFYFTRTDETGHYVFENLRRDTFRLFALEDANANYRFDQLSERIAFLDKEVVTGRDTSGTEQWPLLRLFEQEKPLQLLDVEAKSYGFLSLLFNRSPWDLEVQALPEPDFIYRKVEQDSLLIWYHQADAAAWALVCRAEDFVDTVFVRPEQRSAFLQARVLGFRQTGPSAFVAAPARGKGEGRSQRGSASLSLPVLRQLPGMPVVLAFDAPLEAVEGSLLIWQRDSLEEISPPHFAIDSVDARRVLFTADWQAGSTYRLLALPGAFRDVYAATHDSLYRAWQIRSEEDLSSLRLKLNFPDSTQNYLLHLLKGQELIQAKTASGQAVLEWYFPALEPGDYVLEVVEDANGNGRWDTGNFWKARQAERLFVRSLEPLRPNWEVQAEVEVRYRK